MGARSRSIAAISIAFACGAATAGSAEGGAATTPAVVLAPPPHGRIYHAAFLDFGGPEDRVRVSRIHSFERLAGRRVAWAYFSNAAPSEAPTCGKHRALLGVRDEDAHPAITGVSGGVVSRSLTTCLPAPGFEAGLAPISDVRRLHYAPKTLP